MITNRPYATYNERLAELTLLPLSFRRDILDCGFLRKARAGIFGFTILNLCNVLPFRHNPRLDPDENLLRLQPANTETFEKFYTRRIAQTWNTLPIMIRNIPFNRKSPAFKNAINRWYNDKVTSTFDPYNECTWVTKCRCPHCRAQYLDIQCSQCSRW